MQWRDLERAAIADWPDQTYRTNEQMMQAMKGATTALGAMNKSMNLPQLQRIAMEFEKENDIMDQRQEMMDDAIDDAMDTGVEEEGDEVVEQVLEEIGVDLSQSVGFADSSPASAMANRSCAVRRDTIRLTDERCARGSRGPGSSSGRRRRRRWRRRPR